MVSKCGYNLPINGVFLGVITHLLTIYILSSWDIQVGLWRCFFFLGGGGGGKIEAVSLGGYWGCSCRGEIQDSWGEIW